MNRRPRSAVSRHWKILLYSHRVPCRMDVYIQLTTVFTSGLFGLLVCIVTLVLTSHKESRAEHRLLIREEKTKFENLYAENIAIFEKCIRYTHSREPFSDLYDDLAKANARMRLLSVVEVIQELETASDLLYQWSREYRDGMPKPVGDSGFAITSSHDFPHHENARELFPKLHNQINIMIAAMQTHLASIELQMQNAK